MSNTAWVFCTYRQKFCRVWVKISSKFIFLQSDFGMWPFGYAQDRLRLVPRLLKAVDVLKIGYCLLKIVDRRSNTGCGAVW